MEIKERLELDILIAQMSSYCAFSLGKSHLENITPSFDKLIIKRDNKRISEALDCTYKFGSMPFNGFKDTTQTLQFCLKNKILTSYECLNIIDHLRGINDINAFFKDKSEMYESLYELVSSLFYDDNLYKYLLSIFNEYGEVKDSASKELSEIRHKLRKIENDIASLTEKFKRENGSKLVDGIVSSRNDRVVLLVKNSDKNSLGGFVYGESASGQAVYLEPPAFIEINNKKLNLKSSEAEEIEKILTEVSQRIKEVATFLLYNLDTVSLLDSLFARAQWGKFNDCTIGKLSDDQDLFIKKARHPLIDKKKVVSNTYRIENPHKVLLITGPNTGGKTVSLKIIGLMVLMTYSGMPISVEEATIPFFDKLFIDIGDEQSVVSSLSTFSAHLSNLANVCNNATSKSLVLLDELGSGTDPKEGESLAIAVLNELRERKCMIVATTHYGRLKSYGKKHDDILVAMVQFDIEKLEPTYKFIEGLTGQSNAFDIALKFGLNPRIIKNAKFLKDQGKSLEDELIEKLEKQLLVNKNLELSLNEKLSENTKLEKHLSKLKEELEDKKESYLEEAKFEADLYLEEKMNEANKIISELRSSGTNIKYHEALQIKKKLEPKEEKIIEPIITKEFLVGDNVIIKSNNQFGVITNINKKQATVDVRGISIVVKISNLKHTDRKITKPKEKNTFVNTFKITETKFECNLIGLRVDEALNELDKFLDDAKFSRLPMVRIVHGDGTGALRKAVHERLRNDSSVKEFRLGMPNEGGTGATIVTL